MCLSGVDFSFPRHQRVETMNDRPGLRDIIETGALFLWLVSWSGMRTDMRMDIKQSVWYFFGESSTQKLPNNYQKQSEVSNEQIRGQKILSYPIFPAIQYGYIMSGRSGIMWEVFWSTRSPSQPQIQNWRRGLAGSMGLIFSLNDWCLSVRIGP